MRSSSALTHAALSTIALLNWIAILTKVITSGDSLGSLGDVLITWAVCAFIFSVAMFFVVLVLRIIHYATRLHGSNLETAQYLPAHTVRSLHASEPWCPTPTRARETMPAYCTPVETLNIYSEGASSASAHPTSATITTVVKSHEDDCTFATSPFTSPPIYAIEIFVSKEQMVFHDDAVRVDSHLSEIELDTEASDKAEPKPTHERPARAAPQHQIPKLFQLCELVIMKSNNELL